MSFLCWINQSKCCCNYFFTVLTWQNSVCLPIFPQEHTSFDTGQQGLELPWGIWQPEKERLRSGAAGTGTCGGSSCADVAAGGLYNKAEPCQAGHRVCREQNWECRTHPQFPRDCGDVAGESPCLEEWKQSTSKEGKRNSREIASGKNPRVRNRLQPHKLYGLKQNHSSAGQNHPHPLSHAHGPVLGTPSLPTALG